MTPAVSVLIPYAPAGEERQQVWEWIARRWHRAMPEAEIVVRSPDRVGDPGLFSRAVALNRAAARATGDVFVLADADTAFDPAYVWAAARATAAGTAPWVLPGRYVRLSQRLTAEWTAQPPASPPPPSWTAEIEEEWPANVSGIVVLTRAAYAAAHGFDERFRGWGWEDGSFACALETLWGKPERVEGHVAWHLWHPRPPEHSIYGPHAVEQQRLGQRYLRAAGDPAAMVALIEEQWA